MIGINTNTRTPATINKVYTVGLLIGNCEGGIKQSTKAKATAIKPNPPKTLIPYCPPGTLKARGKSGCVFLSLIPDRYISMYIIKYKAPVSELSRKKATLTSSITKYIAHNKVTNPPCTRRIFCCIPFLFSLVINFGNSPSLAV